MTQDKLRKHIRQIIKEELDTQNEILGFFKQDPEKKKKKEEEKMMKEKEKMMKVKEKLENMINDMDASGKEPIQTSMSKASKEALRQHIKDYIDPVINTGDINKFTSSDFNSNIIGYDGRRTASAISGMVKGNLKGRSATGAIFRENEDNISETWYRMKVLAGVIK